MTAPVETPLPCPTGLLKMIASTGDDEIDCAGAFDLMHRYADLICSGENPAELFSAVKRHIEICHDCREELEALLRAIHAGDYLSARGLPAAGKWRP